MKNYTITVNGMIYDVAVAEAGEDIAATVPAPAPKTPLTQAAVPQTVVPQAAAAPAPVVKAASAAVQQAAETPHKTGAIEVKAGAAGKIFKIEASVGQQVKAGDPIVILEAMKMEIPIVAPEDGTVASIDASVGDAVEAGAVLATLN